MPARRSASESGFNSAAEIRRRRRTGRLCTDEVEMERRENGRYDVLRRTFVSVRRVRVREGIW